MIAVIDYGSGNIQSVLNAIDDTGAKYVVTNKEFEICKSEKIIFPGVGEASFAVKRIHMLNLFTMLRVVKIPILGICLGMQLMCEKSEEGNASCLGIFEATSLKFDSSKVKVPHMGWNKISKIKDSKLFDGIPNGTYFYFAHSYYVPVIKNASAVSSHGIEFSSSIEKGNYYGVQFHPEKSGPAGIQLLKNFIEKC